MIVPKTLLAGLLLLGAAPFVSGSSSMPHLIEQNGRHALVVDGEPFLILGGQCHNSSAWPETLPAVWAAAERMGANTVEAPVYWEQFEPSPGRFDPSLVDLLLQQAREHDLRLVLLWFGTWKNGSGHYQPLWMKADPSRYPRLLGRDGRAVDSPSPLAPATLEADKRAFAALMRHLKQVDQRHTVILVQVENEPGTWGSVRDFSPAAERLFAAPVPAELPGKLGLSDRPAANWSSMFGPDADEFFHAWSVARFIGEVAAAGKAEYPLPMYVNVALRDPIHPGAASTYESGGATDNVLAIWKAAAPQIDLLAPDIYRPTSEQYLRVLQLYSRPDNPLYIPETIGAPTVSRFCYAALSRGAIGWAPFGIDGPPRRQVDMAIKDDPIPPMFRALGRSNSEWAALAFAGKLRAAWEEKDRIAETIALGSWQGEVTFGPPAFGYGRNPHGNAEPVGRALIGELGPNEFLVTGYLCRVDFKPADSSANRHRDFVRVEEGTCPHGEFQPRRIWNGDETDWGLNFGTGSEVIRVRLGTSG